VPVNHAVAKQSVNPGAVMTIDSEVRICVNCGSEIPKWKAKGTKVCSAKCKFEQKTNKKATKYNSGPLLHACLFNILDAPKDSCLCRKRLTDKQAQRMIANGEAVDFKTRLPVYEEGADLLVAGKNLKFPRAATIETAHVERLTDRYSSKNKSDESTEELQKAIEEDRALRAQEEVLRMQIYGELTAALRRKWIVEVPADEYDRAKLEARGRSLFWFDDERTPGGVGINVNPLSLAPLAPIETADQEEDESEAVENVVVETNPETETESEIKTESLENINSEMNGIVEISLDEEIEKEIENDLAESEEFV
jgi:hypothetical protein